MFKKHLNSLAAISALEDKITQKGEDCYWLRADPVALKLDWQHVYMLGNQHFQLTSQESQAILTLINQHLSSYNLEIVAPHPMRWYLRLPENPQLESFNPNDIIGRSIIQYLPSGVRGAFWRQLFNEIQMLLHASDAKIDAIWFWGGQPKISLWKKIWKKLSFVGRWNQN